MLTDRLLRQIDHLLDEAEQALGANDWERVRARCQAVLRLDPSNADATAYLEAVGPRPRAEGVRSEGERRVVTVLFSDARGFTAMSEQTDEEVVYRVIQECLRVMAEEVSAVEGTVTQFRGDGIMALFGAPVAHEDAARRGVAAALRMQERLGELAVGLRAQWGMAPEFRIGLNTGPAVVGSINETLAMDFTALGDTVNLASRMEQTAQPGSVQISEATWRAVRGYFECEALGAIEVKGKREAVRAFRVLRGSGARTRLDVARASGLSTFQGRQAELAVLQGALQRVRQGEPQAVLITGEAGVGKSRLLLEFMQSIDPAEVRWLPGQCSPLTRLVPYLPLIEIVKRAFGIREGDRPDEMEAALSKGCELWQTGGSKAVPYLRFLLGLPSGDPRIDGMDPVERRVGLLEAIQQHVEEELRGKTLVLVVEDVHWIDEPSDTVLRLLSSGQRGRLLFLFTARPEYQGELVRGAQRLHLDHLAADAVTALANAVAGGHGLPEAAQRWLRERTGGNPLYVEELVHTLLETGAVRNEDGVLVMAQPLESVHIPDTLQGVILSRMDRLDPAAREALQVASVIGREFAVRLLDRVSEEEGAHLDRGTLGELGALELIREKARYPELAYMFKHALTHDVAYATLLHSRRKQLHRLAARAIEEIYGDQIEEYLEVLAEHTSAGDDHEVALGYLRRAAEKAVARFSVGTALGFLDRALGLAHRLGQAETAVHIELRRGTLQLSIWDIPAAAEAFDRARAQASSAGLHGLAGLALAYRSFVAYWAHQFEEAEALALQALEVGANPTHPHPDVELLSRVVLALLYLGLGRIAEARVHSAAAERLAPAVADPGAQSWAAFASWHFHDWEGRFDEAVAAVARWAPAIEQSGNVVLTLGRLWLEALPLAGKGEYSKALGLLATVLTSSERVGEVLWRTRAQNVVGWIYHELGDPQTALEWNQRSLDGALAAGFPDPEIENNARLNLADNHMALGQWAEAESHLRIVERVVRNPRPEERIDLRRYAQHFHHSLGEFQLQHGDLDGARQSALECLEIAIPSEHHKNVAKGRRLLGQVAMVQGDLVGARNELEAALHTARSIGNPPQIWRTEAVLAELERRSDNPAEARAHVTAAMACISAVAAGLRDERIRARFLGSAEVTGLRRG